VGDGITEFKHSGKALAMVLDGVDQVPTKARAAGADRLLGRKVGDAAFVAGSSIDAKSGVYCFFSIEIWFNPFVPSKKAEPREVTQSAFPAQRGDRSLENR